MTDAEVQQAAKAAMAKMSEGLSDYIAAVKDQGDTVAVINAYVLFEMQGIEPDGTTFSGTSHVVIEQGGTMAAGIGLLTVEAPRLAQRLQSGCDHDHEG